jgi:hypothetical protein
VLRVLNQGDVSAWTVASWLRSPELGLALPPVPRTPVEVLLTGEDDVVLRVAKRVAAGWG